MSHIELHDSVMMVKDLQSPYCVVDFINCIKEIEHRKKEIKIKWCGDNTKHAFPNACVPISGLMDCLRANGLRIVIDKESNVYFRRTNFGSAEYLSAKEIDGLKSPLRRVVLYHSYDQVYEYTEKCLSELSRLTVCEKGVIEGLSWCINEVMENVLTHSKCKSGYVMMEYLPRADRIIFCISDNGIGIYNSFFESKYNPHTPEEAILLALKDGVTDGTGQGNGLFGLYEILSQNGGDFTITSSGTSIRFSSGGKRTINRVPVLDDKYPGTTIDFQLHLKKKVDMVGIFSKIGHDFDEIDFSVEKMMDDDEIVQYDVMERCCGTATRESGRRSRNDVLNLLARSKGKICLNFENVHRASSSFIDEFIAIMIENFGIQNFNKSISIRGMNETIRAICKHSVSIRLKKTIGSK